MMSESKENSDFEKAETTQVEEALDTEENKKAGRTLLRKLDATIMPVSIILYICGYLDRGAIGNARIMGLPEDILGGDPSGNLYQWAASMFYFSYVIFLVPFTFGPKIIRPDIWMGGVAVVWGTAATCAAGSTNFAGIMVSRFFIGVGEAGFGSSIPLIFSIWYTKREMSTRFAWFIASAALGGAFGGLLAYGIQQIDSHIASWRCLFLIEGLPGVALGVVAMFWLPTRPESSKLLNEKERRVAMMRKMVEMNTERHSKVSKQQLIRTFKDYRLYVCCVIYMFVTLMTFCEKFVLTCSRKRATQVALAALGAFLPTIVQSFGYEGARAQLMTVPPYSAALVYMMIVCWISDRMQLRGPWVASSVGIGCAGYIMLLAVPTNNHVRYGAVFLICIGTYAAMPLFLGWLSSNSGGETQRALNFGVTNASGQCMAILATHLYPTSEAPNYHRGFGTACAFQGFSVCLSLFLSFMYWRENRRRDRLYGKPDPSAEVDTATYGDAAPNFRYVL